MLSFCSFWCRCGIFTMYSCVSCCWDLEGKRLVFKMLSYAVCFYCHRHTYTEIPRTLTPETGCLTDFCLAVDLQTSFRFVLYIIRRNTLGRFPSTSGCRTSKGTEDGRGREHQAAGLWSGSQWVEGSHGPSVCAAPGRAWVGSVQLFRKELSCVRD